MSVRSSLLSLLAQEPCYGYQLRAEYERRTGVALNVGQVYTTLERLERDGLVENRGPGAQGHVYWAITAAGRADAERWLAEPAPAPARDELAQKIALAATLPGADVAAIVATQRRAALARIAALDAETDGEPPRLIVRAAERARAEAEVRWLDAVDALTDALPEAARTFGVSADRPRRGRPVRG